MGGGGWVGGRWKLVANCYQYTEQAKLFIWLGMIVFVWMAIGMALHIMSRYTYLHIEIQNHLQMLNEA